MSTTFTDGKLACYEKMMKRTPMPDKSDTPKCHTCSYYRPNWKYRTCYFTSCYRDRKHRTFRERAYEPGRGEKKK
ncbi:MAG: hypothetical protein Q4C42_08925 [Clostridia bacterium]|nr:hypothetical protein [Clostridia bacterium]